MSSKEVVEALLKNGQVALKNIECETGTKIVCERVPKWGCNDKISIYGTEENVELAARYLLDNYINWFASHHPTQRATRENAESDGGSW